MKTLQTLLLDQHDGILTITINRESVMNALNQLTLNELKTAIQDANENFNIRGIIITGQGDKAFVAGADIKELTNINESFARKLAENGQEIFNTIERLSKPVIAAINGYALGGGCELAMACHIRIATANANFGQPEVNLGIIPGYGGTQRLTQLIGKGKAMELIMTADMINADQALELGLINYKLKSKKEMMGKAHEILNKIKEKAPLAIGMSIDCINAVYTSGENGYQTEANSFGRLCTTDDFKEGTSAFIEKRKPNFTGN